MRTESKSAAAPDAAQPEIINYAEAATLLGVPIGTLYAWVHERRVPHIRLSGRLVRFEAGSLRAYLDAHRVAPAVR